MENCPEVLIIDVRKLTLVDKYDKRILDLSALSELVEHVLWLLMNNYAIVLNMHNLDKELQYLVLLEFYDTNDYEITIISENVFILKPKSCLDGKKNNKKLVSVK